VHDAVLILTLNLQRLLLPLILILPLSGHGMPCPRRDSRCQILAGDFVFAFAVAAAHFRAPSVVRQSPNPTATKPYDRVIVIFRNSAIRSESGGCVLNKPENNCPADNGCTMHNAEVDCGISMGIFLL
jgi:hypothetical protein